MWNYDTVAKGRYYNKSNSLVSSENYIVITSLYCNL